MRMKTLVIAMTFLAIFAMASRVSVDSDTWWHLRTGAWILEHRALPEKDPFSYTRLGAPWNVPGWVVQIPMVLIYESLGPAGLNLLTAAAATLAFAVIYPILDGGVFLKAFILILAASAAGVYWAARPYMLTFVLAAVFLVILEQYRTGRRNRLWLLPILMVLWANGHGGFAAGFLIYGIYLGGHFFREFPRTSLDGLKTALFKSQSFIWIGLALLLAVTVNPSGVARLAYPFQTVSIESLQDFIQEWQSPDFHQNQVQPFAWLIFLVFGAAAASKRGLTFEDFLLVSLFGYLGLISGRNIALFALVAALVLARHGAIVVERLPRWINVDRRPTGFQSALNFGLFLSLLAATGLKTYSVLPEAVNQAAYAKYLPVGAVEYLHNANPQGRMFNTYNWGAYLLWALPEYPVFIDGRTDLYTGEVIADWFQIARAEPGWEQKLDRWEVRLVLVEPGLPIADELLAAGWQVLYQDDLSVLLRR